MGNLGWYQIVTTWSKKVGGPLKLLAIVFGGGTLFGGGTTLGIQKIKKAILKNLEEKRRSEESAVIYTVKCDGQSNEGLRFKEGEQFKVLETDGDAGLIEKIGDSNNPYFVSLKFLHSISNYS